MIDALPAGQAIYYLPDDKTESSEKQDLQKDHDLLPHPASPLR